MEKPEDKIEDVLMNSDLTTLAKDLSEVAVNNNSSSREY
jgi:hypothetical protein